MKLSGPVAEEANVINVTVVETVRADELDKE